MLFSLVMFYNNELDISQKNCVKKRIITIITSHIFTWKNVNWNILYNTRQSWNSLDFMNEYKINIVF